MDSTHAPPRRPGRPGPRQSAAADADRLLDTAVTLFARHGIAATTLRRVAQSAGVSPAMLHYHFGDKDGLVAAAIAQRILPAVEGLRGAVTAAGENPRAIVQGFLAAALQLGQSHPWLPGLWVREVLCEGGALRELLVGRVADILPKALAQHFAKARDAGRIAAALDPRLMVVSLLGLSLFPLAAAPIWRQVFAADDIGTEQMLAHTLALIGPGLEPPDA